MSEVQGKVCLVLLEGIGENKEEKQNAVMKGDMSYFNSLKADERSLFYELDANGLAVCYQRSLTF